MRIIVTGSRWHTTESMLGILWGALQDASAPSGKGLTIIHGAANGADTVAARAAAKWGANEYRFPAEWKRYGKAAGAMRNAEMLKLSPDLVLAFPRKGSKGTWSMVTQAHRSMVRVEVLT